MAVARDHGIEVGEPRVLKDLSNVLVELAPAPLVARVATTTAAARPGGARDWLARDVAVAGFLAERGAAVVPPAGELPPGPHVEDGLAISFWRLVASDPDRRAPFAEAGTALRRLHTALEGFAGELPPLAGMLDEAHMLIERLGLGARLRPALAVARAEIDAASLPVRPLHGDATRSNLLCTPQGLVWTDFEDTCLGPVQWDLACMVTTVDPRADEALTAYEDQLVAEGVAPDAVRLDPPTLAPLLEARRLQLAVWTAFMAERHPHLRPRAEERLSRWP